MEVFSMPCGHVQRNVGVSRGSGEDSGRSWKDHATG